MRTLKACGTHAAYVRHLRHDEKPCEACNRENSRRSILYYQAKAKLRDLHPALFGTLLREEAPGPAGYQAALGALTRIHDDQYRDLLAKAGLR